MAKYDIGPKVGIEGEAEFKRAIAGINTSLQTMSTEMRAVTSAYDRNDKSAENLTAQNQVLNKQIEAQKTKLAELNAMLEKSKDAYGENDAKTQKYQQDVNRATAELNKMERQLDNNNQALEGYAAETQKAAWQTEEFKQKTKEMGESLKNVGGKIKGFGKTMSMAVTAPIVAAGAASFKFAADLQDAMGATDQIFKGASDSVKEWADNLNSQYGIAEAEALTYANTMGAMLQNIGGLSEQEASKQSQTLVQLAGDLAAMFGGTTESAIQALTGALKGNNAMLDNYGMGVNDATIKAKAFEMGLYDGKGAMELSTKQAATLALIMEQTADAQGQAAREADGASGSIRSLQTDLKNIATDIGEILIPIILPLLQNIKEMIKKFSELSPEMRETIVKVLGLAAAIGPLLIVVGQIITAVGAITTALPVLGAAFAALTGPIGIVVAAIAGAIAILYKNWDTIKEKVGELRDAIDEKITAIKEGITNAFNAVINFFKTNWQTLLSFIINPFGGAIKLLYDLNPQFRQWMDALWNNFMVWVGNFSKIGKRIVEGIWSGIKGAAGWLANKIKGFVNGIIAAFTGKDGIDAHSPSRKFAKFGKYMAQGLGEGFTNEMNNVARQMNSTIPTDAHMTYQTEGIVNGLASVIGAGASTGGGGGGTYTINVVLPDGKALASVVFDPLKQVAKQKGVALA